MNPAEQPPAPALTAEALAAMLASQTEACAPAREALLAGARFDGWGTLVPASQHAGVFRGRALRMRKRGRPTLTLDATVDILAQLGDAPVRNTIIDPPDRTWWYLVFANTDATQVLACAGIYRGGIEAGE